MSSSPLAGVTDSVTDAWSTSSSVVADLATTAAELATDVAIAAVGQLEELPDRLAGLAALAKDRVGPAPKRSKKPVLFVLLLAIAAAAGVVWWKRRGPAGDVGATGTPS
ncbi:MAG: hypothetical protein ABW328_06165, partial [Ilumatobacteraceae bacterium]